MVPFAADQKPTVFPADTNGQHDPMSPADETSPLIAGSDGVNGELTVEFNGTTVRPHHIRESSASNELTPATNNGGHNPDGAASQSDDKNDTPQLSSSFETSITTSLGSVNSPPVKDEQRKTGDGDTSSGEEERGHTCSYELFVLENKKTN